VSDYAVELKGVTKQFGQARAVDNISLGIKRGEFFGLLGPSGCGKTTLLRIISGLEDPDYGEVFVDGKLSNDLYAHERPVNTVFQSYALFPHMTVRQNVEFGLRMKKFPENEITKRVNSTMEMVQITGFASRYPAQLSGGQQQRVALARAVVNEPQVLLLDEPLGALDTKLRKELQIELMRLQRRLGITFILVTHDQEEALAMSDRIAVMNQGHFEQVGTGEEIYEHPRTAFAAKFLGSANIFDADVLSAGPEAIQMVTSLGTISCAKGDNSRALASRTSCKIALRPEKIILDRSKGDNSFPVKIDELVYIGSETHYVLRAGDTKFVAETMNVQVGPQGFNLGESCFATIPPGAFIVLED
jgi:spermidine/putrescine transport system ATP-binding protein